MPAWDVSTFLPDLKPPAPGEPIVNVHFKLLEAPEGFDAVDLVGVINGFAQWIFVRGPLVSITISAAASEAALEAQDIAERCWIDVCATLRLEASLPPYRVIKERRATFEQTPDALKHRTGPRTSLSNTFIAGDWTDTGLPATIEGAIKSGNAAAQAIGRSKSRAA